MSLEDKDGNTETQILERWKENFAETLKDTVELQSQDICDTVKQIK